MVAPSATMTEEPTSNKWLVLTAVSMGVFTATIDASIVNISLATLQEELDTTFALIQWVVLAYLLVLTGLVMIFGRLGDMLGKKRLYQAGFAIFTAGSFLCGLSPGIEWLIAFRVLQGIGGAITQALGIAIVTEAFPSSERGKALGIIGSLVSVGIALGPSLGGILIDTVGWRSIFLVNVPIGLLGIYLTWQYVPSALTRDRQRFDLLGAVLLTSVLLCFSIGMTLAQEFGFVRIETIGLLIATVIFMVAFILTEQRVAHPIVNLTLFKQKEFSLGLYTAVSVFVTIGGLVIIPFYLQEVLDLRIRTVGLLMASFPIVLGVVSPFSGSLSDRVGTQGIAIIGLLVSSAACFGIATLGKDASQLDVILWLMLFGAGFGIFQSPNNSTIMGSAPKAQLGVASGLLATTRNVGQGAGIPILSTIFAAGIAAHVGRKTDVLDAPVEAILSGFQTTFAVAGGIIFVAFLVSLATYLHQKTTT